MIPINNGIKPPNWIWIALLSIFSIGIWFDSNSFKEFITLFGVVVLITLINILYWKNNG